MPFDTFNRLPKEKKELFLQAALEEFASHTFEQASITRLVKNLGIAKGSVYQYFSDKFDLYNYSVNRSYSKLEEILNFVDNRGYDELTPWYVNRTIAEIKFAQEFQSDFKLIRNVKKITNGLFNKTWQKEELNKFQTLIKLRYADAETRSFIAYHTKERFLEEKYNSPIDESFEELQKISNIIFK